jgi:osmotically inducible lipoprotein OsmB
LQLKPEVAQTRLCKGGVIRHTETFMTQEFTHMKNRWFVPARWVLWAVLGLGLTACSSLSHRDRNTITGAAIGGVAGAVLTGGSSVGTVGGAAVGGVIGHQIGSSNKRK